MEYFLEFSGIIFLQVKQFINFVNGSKARCMTTYYLIRVIAKTCILFETWDLGSFEPIKRNREDFN